MFDILNLAKYKIVISIVLTIVGIISWKFWDYNRTIEKQAALIQKLQKQVAVYQVDIETEKNNVITITNVVKEQHKTIDSLKARNQNIEKKYEDFKKLTAKEKYKNERALALMESKLFSSSNCEDGLELNRRIAKLSYDDL